MNKPVRPAPKRFNVGPLNDHDNDWLMVWTALQGATSPGEQAAVMIEDGIKANKPEIEKALRYNAQIRGISPTELFGRILEEPKYLRNNPPTEYPLIEEGGTAA